MSQPRIAIIVSNFNGAKRLQRTLPSLIAQEYPGFEVIIADADSDDDSASVSQKFSRVQICTSPTKRSKNAACNHAATQTDAEYLLFLDNDALLPDSDFLAKLSRFSLNHPDAGLIGIAFFDEGSECTEGYGKYLGLSFVREMKALGPEDVASLNGATIGFPSGLGIFIRSDRWREAGGYDEAFTYGGDDSDLGIKMWLLGYRNYLFSESYAIHMGDEKRVTIDMYCFKLKNFTSAGFYTIFKNYSSVNLGPALLAFGLKSIMKMIKQALRWRSMKPVFATLAGYGHFLAISSAAFDLRRLIQARRKIRRDIFLFKPPIPNRNRS